MPPAHAQDARVRVDHFRVTGNTLPQPWQGMEGVPVVGLGQRPPYFGELQHEQASARPQDALHFCQRGLLVGHIAQPEGDADTVEIIVRKGQRLGIALDHGQQSTAVDEPVAPHFEHFAIDVRDPDFAR